MLAFGQHVTQCILLPERKRGFFKTCCGTALILSCSLLFCHAADSEVPGFRLRMGECEAMGSWWMLPVHCGEAVASPGGAVAAQGSPATGTVSCLWCCVGQQGAPLWGFCPVCGARRAVGP